MINININPLKMLLPPLVAMLVFIVPFAAAHGQAIYPDQPIKLIIPYPPGGGTDLIGRIVGKALADGLHANVVVHNKGGGAGGSIGAVEVANAAPDGYTLLLAAVTSHSVYQKLYAKNASYDLNKDFQPVAIVGSVPQVLVANPSLNAKTLTDLIASAKKNPGKHSIGFAGGSPQQMAAALLGITAEINLLQVPYRGSGPAMIDLLGGQVDMMIGTVPSVQGHVSSGKLKGLVISSRDRSPTLPDVPTAKEAGLGEFNVGSVFGVLAPAGTPIERVNVLARTIEKALADNMVRNAFLSQGVIPDFEGPDDAKAAISAELAKWQQVIEKAGIEAK